jgi:hypothetical protein
VNGACKIQKYSILEVFSDQIEVSKKCKKGKMGENGKRQVSEDLVLQ